MKRLLLIASLVFAVSAQAQEDTSERQNDIMISLIELITGKGMLGIGYRF